MASPSFYESMNSLGWSRRQAPAPTTASGRVGGDGGFSGFMNSLRSYNPFGEDRGYIGLSDDGIATETTAPPPRRQEDSWLYLSRWDRMLVFAGCNIGALLCFSLCTVFLFFPPLMLKPRKFATLWSLGSGLFITSWAALMGLVPYLRHLLSGPRLPFTAVYFSSIALTLYFSIGLHSTILTFISAIMQIVALIWYLVSYFPWGSQGLRLAARAGGGSLMAWMND